MSAYCSDALICKKCGATWETNSYSREYLDGLRDCSQCGEENSIVYYTVQDRYERDGDYWCKACGMYHESPVSTSMALGPTDCPRLSEEEEKEPEGSYLAYSVSGGYVYACQESDIPEGAVDLYYPLPLSEKDRRDLILQGARPEDIISY